MTISKYKRLIVACDGTWMNSDNGFERDSYLPWDTNGHLQTPSNVTRIHRAILPESNDGIPQISYYQAGIGTENTWWDHVYGGGTGAGLSENIREAYAFLAANYLPGDEIILLGFSRGAFTARSLASMIATVGLLTPRGMADFYEIFEDWENQSVPGWVSKWTDRPFANRPNITNPEYQTELDRLGFARLNIPIRAIGVWDTVGALGIPSIGILHQKPMAYSFVNTAVPHNVENAFHALALDEHRKPFSPTIWEKPEGQALPTVLRQCWFPGVHSNVGGSYDDSGLADITLAWMMSQLAPFLALDMKYVAWQHELNTKYYQQNHQQVREWGMGKIYNSMTGIEVIAGKKVRTPGRYRVTDWKSGKATSRELRDTREFVHASVRVRKDLGGRGEGDKGLYNPTSLIGYHLVGNPHQGNVRWVYKGAAGEPERVLEEDILGETELELLAKSSRAYNVATHGEKK